METEECLCCVAIHASSIVKLQKFVKIPNLVRWLANSFLKSRWYLCSIPFRLQDKQLEGYKNGQWRKEISLERQLHVHWIGHRHDRTSFNWWGETGNSRKLPKFLTKFVLHTDCEHFGLHARITLLATHHAFDESQPRSTSASSDPRHQRWLLPHVEIHANLQGKSSRHVRF